MIQNEKIDLLFISFGFPYRNYKRMCEDVNGYNIMSRVSANVEYLDVTVPGKYPVVFYVTDFAGNRTEIEDVVEVTR